jgi:glycosyltransferase involved in cell wall biosynthesis
MRILIVNDFHGWAISKLSDVIAKHNSYHQIGQIYIPPKELRADPEGKMKEFEEAVLAFNPEIIHFQYWDIANTLTQSPVCRNRKLILTHHNQKNLLTYRWDQFDMLVVHTKKAKEILTSAGYWNVEIIQHGIDIEKFAYLEEYDPNNRVIGYVGRIVPWKGLYEILKVAKELDTEVLMMGRIDKGDYWKKCLEFEEQMDVCFGTPDNLQTEIYHRMGIYVGNSCDNMEEGTLGLLEAMACGIPVVTTPSGEAADLIQDGVNGVLVDFENEESLKKGIERIMGMDRNALREKAWHTVRTLNEETMARKYEKVYYAMAYPRDLVSVIIPTCKRPDTITKILDGYARQTYSPMELIVVIDEEYPRMVKEGQKTTTWDTVKEWGKMNPGMVVTVLCTNYGGYGLAMARNMGIFEAAGNYIVFSDDRFNPDDDAVERFVNRIKQEKNPCAVWGDKGAGRRDFIENFFIIRKKDIVNAGMFNERINEYGGQSQEIRERLHCLGYGLIYEPLAKSEPLFGTHNRSSKKYQLVRMKTKLWKLRN